MKQPHKHAEVIKAWADGAAVQYFVDNRWHDMLPHAAIAPSFDPSIDWRVKPEPRKGWYRVALMFDGETHCPLSTGEFVLTPSESELERDEFFSRWLTPRTEYEVD